jgi:hypothetical protein
MAHKEKPKRGQRVKTNKVHKDKSKKKVKK